MKYNPTNSLRDLAPHIVALCVVAIWGYIQIHIVDMTRDITPSLHDIVIRTLGTLDGALMVVLTWYFGGTHKEREVKPEAPPVVEPAPTTDEPKP